MADREPYESEANFPEERLTTDKMALLISLQAISKMMTWPQGLYLMACYTLSFFFIQNHTLIEKKCPNRFTLGCGSFPV